MLLALLFTMSMNLSYANVISVYKNDPTWIADAHKNYSRHSNLPDGVENRVMFDEDIWWALDRANTDAIINRLAEAGFNVYIPCVWHGAGTYYTSSVAYQNPQILARIKNGDDPLKYLIEKAHAKNIEVHVWVTVVRRDDDKYRIFYDTDSPESAFDIHNLKFRQFVTSLMLELVKNYDVDGLNLDYIRSMGYCASKKCENDYEEKFSRNLQIDILLNRVLRGGIKSIELWNEEAVEDIVKSISEKLKLLKPKLILSIDSVPNARDFRLQGQDSLKWLNNKWIDVIFYMEYHNDFQIEQIELAKSYVHNPDAIIPLFSLYDLSTLEQKPGALLKKSILATRRLWPDSGVAFYHYKQLNTEQVSTLKSSVYANPSHPTWR